MTTFASLMPELTTADIDCGWGLTLHMTYRPRQIRITLEEAEEDIDAPDTPERRNRYAEQIVEAVEAWDAFGPIPMPHQHVPGFPVGAILAEGELCPVGKLLPDGRPDPAQVRMLSFLPQPLLAGIVGGFVRHAQPDPTRTPSGSRGRGSTGTTTASTSSSG